MLLVYVCTRVSLLLVWVKPSIYYQLDLGYSKTDKCACVNFYNLWELRTSDALLDVQKVVGYDIFSAVCVVHMQSLVT